MGLFGAIYTGISLLIHATDKIITDAECIEAKKNGDGLTFVDSKGKTRLRSTGQIVTYGFHGRDYVLYDGDTMNIIYNFTDKKNKQKIISNKRKTIDKSQTTFCCDEKTYEKISNVAHGKRFKDIKTGEIYVIRQSVLDPGIYYYYDYKKAIFIRPTDWQQRHFDKWHKNIDLNRLNDAIIDKPFYNNGWKKEYDNRG